MKEPSIPRTENKMAGGGCLKSEVLAGPPLVGPQRARQEILFHVHLEATRGWKEGSDLV